MGAFANASLPACNQDPHVCRSLQNILINDLQSSGYVSNAKMWNEHQDLNADRSGEADIAVPMQHCFLIATEQKEHGYQEDRQGSLLYACWSCEVHRFQMLAQHRRQPQALHTCTDSQPPRKHASLQVDTSLQATSGPFLRVACLQHHHS